MNATAQDRDQRGKSASRLHRRADRVAGSRPVGSPAPRAVGRVQVRQRGQRIQFTVSKHLRVSEEVLGDELPGALYVYKRKMHPKTILEKWSGLLARERGEARLQGLDGCDRFCEMPPARGLPGAAPRLPELAACHVSQHCGSAWPQRCL